MLDRLLSAIFSQNATDYLERRGYALDGVCIFLLMLLIYMETKYHPAPKRKRLRNVRQVADMLGVHNTQTREALQALQEQKLVYWFHDEGYSVNYDLFLDILEPGRDVPKCAPSSVQAFHYMADLFFTPEKRKLKVGRMDYLEKVLLLSLVISADDIGQVRAFDLERYCRWLGTSVKDLRGRLERLCVTYGLILSYPVWPQLLEGINHNFRRVHLNLAHPWLRHEAGLYVYCQMHNTSMGVELSPSEVSEEKREPKRITLAAEGSAFEEFEIAVLQNCEYGYWRWACNNWWIGPRARREKFCFERYGPEVAASSEMPVKTDKSAVPQTIKRLVRHWGRSGEHVGRSYHHFCADTFSICFQLALDLVSGKVIQGRSMDKTREKCLKRLQSHRLFKERDSFDQGSLKYHYLEMLQIGTKWVLERLLDEIGKALRAHPDFNPSTQQGIEARFVTYLFDPRQVDSFLSVKRRWSLTGAIVFKMAQVKQHIVWGVECPENDRMELIFGNMDYSFFLQKDKLLALVSRYYPGQIKSNGEISHGEEVNSEALSALVGELGLLMGGRISGSKNMSRHVVTGNSKGWVDFIAWHARKTG